MKGWLSSSARTFAVAAISTAATWCALTSWRGLVTYPSAYLWIAAGLGAVLTGLAAVASHLPRQLVIVLEILVCLEAVSWTASGRPLPVHGRAVAHALHAAAQSVDLYKVPLDRSVPTVTPLLVLGAAGFLLLVQLLAVHLRRPPLAGLGLLAIFALHAGFTGLGSNVRSFIGAAAFFLLLLLLDAREGQLRWGRPEPGSGAARDATLLGSLRTATPVGAIAIAVAVLVGAVLPLPTNGIIDLSGASGSKVTIHKPVVDMRGQLSRSADIPLIDITTEQPHPGYLRIGVLNRFTGAEWSSGDRNISPERIAGGPVPLSQGVSAQLTGTDYDLLVHVLPAFDSTWLPTAYPVSRIAAGGDWRWDPSTMDFVAAGHTNAAGETYSMTTEELNYGTDGRFFHDAPAHSVPDEDLYVPSTVSDFVRNLTQRLTAGTTSDYERALRLQAFFRTTGHFTYSVRRAPAGDDGQALDTFLGTGPGGRVGFCQQFSSAMAIMARIAGIPARVAVGFLTPNRIGPSEYEYSSHDLHAWTELYFAGAGWVRFEPTPSARAPHAPAYSTVPVSLPQGGGGKGPGNPQSQPTSTPTGQPTSNPVVPVPSSKQGQNRQDGPAAQQGHTTEWVLGVLGVLLVIALGLLAAARLVRRRQRALRLAGDPEAVWSELRATALDLSIDWPAGRSPRATGRLLATHLTKGGRRVDAEVLDAVDDLVLSLEEYRYGSEQRSVAVAARTDVGTQGAVVVAALEETVTQGQRRRARWLPRSVVA